MIYNINALIMAEMKKFNEIINYLMDPFLVAKIQNFFGVQVYDNIQLSKCKINEYTNNQQLNNSNCHVIKENGSLSLCKSNLNGSLSISHSINQYDDKVSKNNHKKFSNTLPVTNYFWYYLFLFSSELGDELFYTLFIAIWFWNIDDVVGRKVILVWATIMTTGQIMKDVIRWPRPACPPVVRLQDKWSKEYGMPSTHASVSVSIPFSVLLFTMNKYNYSITLGMAIVVIWSTLICISRLYLGMHTVLDVIAGLLLAINLIIPLVPFVNYMDHYLITYYWAIVILIVISITVIIYYPISDKWTPTRSDTTMVVAVVTGIYTGAWLNYQSGLVIPNPNPPPYDIIWPSLSTLSYIILRIISGFFPIILMKFICKKLVYIIMCSIMKINSKKLMESENSLENTDKIIVDLVYKFIYSFALGFAVVSILPRMFTLIGLDRPEFHNEM